MLGVGLLLLINAAQQPRTLILLLLGHIMLALPYVVLVVQARLIGIKRVYEEAALSLGANRFRHFREITLPLLMPAIVASLLLVFTISFDNITASLFWRPPGVETMPTQILVDAEDFDQPGDQCAGHPDGRRHSRRCRSRQAGLPSLHPGTAARELTRRKRENAR